MKKTILLMLFPIILFAVLLQTNALPISQAENLSMTVEEVSMIPSGALTTKGVIREISDSPVNGSEREDIVNYAVSLLGAPYLFAGNTKNGFDCSGFTTHVFDQNGIKIKRSSGLQATEGIPVDRSEATPGDLIIFTGTDRSVREPGHVGIVISEPGDTIEFVHASSSRSDGGVKISKVEGTGYDARFLAIRRVL